MAIIRGTTGNDTLRGTEQADTIYGDRGYDTIYGGGGDDIIYSGEGFPRPGGDIVYGGTGNDKIYLGGNASLNRAFGEAGNDTIEGGEYDDDIDGGDGNDVLTSGKGNDTLTGGWGDDILSSEGIIGGTKVFNGGEGKDTFVLGYAHKGTFSGGNGDDVFLATDFGHGYNHFDGGSGIDIIGARADNARLGISSLNGIEKISSLGRANFTIELKETDLFDSSNAPLTFDFSKTLIEDVTSITGSLRSDTVYMAGAFQGDNAALASNDRLFGSAGNDALYSGYGNDRLDGGSGNDTLVGGTGSDVFIFRWDNPSYGFDNDRIADFSKVQGDKITIANNANFQSFAQVQSVMKDVNGSAVMDFGDGDVLIVSGVTSSQLSAGDFLFA